MKRIAKALVALLAMCSLVACSSSTTVNGNTLTVGVRTNLNRFSYYYEDSDSYYGFEDDIARELADRLGYNVKLVGVAAEDREDALDNGEVDCLVAAFSKTESREEKYNLSTAYYQDYGRVLVQKSTLFENWNSLSGKRIGYRTGTDAMDSFSEKLVSLKLVSGVKNVEEFCHFVELDSYDEIAKALQIGTIDAAILDGCIALGWMDDDMMYLSDEYYSTEEYCVATSKDSSLSDKINSAIEDMINDGTIAQLEDKWDIQVVEEETVDEKE